MNLAAALHAHLSGRPCRTYAGRRRLHFKCRGDDIAYYPDVSVGCGETRNAKGELEDETRLVIEVFSPSTENVDRREKAMTYREIASLEEIVLVAQKRASILVYRRAERWAPVTLDSTADLTRSGLLCPSARSIAKCCEAAQRRPRALGP